MLADVLAGAKRHVGVRSMAALYSETKAVLREIPADFLGGCTLRKAYLIAELIRRYDLKTTVDIGVYRGRSLLPQALAHHRFTGGVAFGIDPWSASEARESDSPLLKEEIDQFIDKTNFQATYEEVKSLLETLYLEDNCVLLRRTSAKAIDFFKQNDVYFDLVHIDGNHDTRIVSDDVRSYVPRLRNMGFVILDDASWRSVRPAYDELMRTMQLVFERKDKGLTNDYAVFWNGASRMGAQTRRFILTCLGAC